MLIAAAISSRKNDIYRHICLIIQVVQWLKVLVQVKALLPITLGGLKLTSVFHCRWTGLQLFGQQSCLIVLGFWCSVSDGVTRKRRTPVILQQTWSLLELTVDIYCFLISWWWWRWLIFKFDKCSKYNESTGLTISGNGRAVLVNDPMDKKITVFER